MPLMFGCQAIRLKDEKKKGLVTGRLLDQGVELLVNPSLNLMVLKGEGSGKVSQIERTPRGNLQKVRVPSA